MDNILQLNGIDKRYDGIHALKSIDLKFKRGEIHSIIGENGAGKSTLGKIIYGIVNPDKGRIIYSEKEITKNNPIIAQKLGISMVTQELDLFPNLTMSENIAINNFSFDEKLFICSIAFFLSCRLVSSSVCSFRCSSNSFLNCKAL